MSVNVVLMSFVKLLHILIYASLQFIHKISRIEKDGVAVLGNRIKIDSAFPYLLITKRFTI